MFVILTPIDVTFSIR